MSRKTDWVLTAFRIAQSLAAKFMPAEPSHRTDTGIKPPKYVYDNGIVKVVSGDSSKPVVPPTHKSSRILLTNTVEPLSYLESAPQYVYEPGKGYRPISNPPGIIVLRDPK